MTPSNIAYRLAALALGTILAAYWLRVARMAHKARRWSGRAGNFLPPERTGLALRTAWVPIVAVWIAQPFITALSRLHWIALMPLWASAWVAWPAAIVAGGCFWATRICWRTMGKSWRMGIDPAERTALILGGPYAWVRHPIYALSQTLMLACMVAIPSPLMLGAGLMHLLLLQWEARREEAYLRRVHGRPYIEYCVRVGRFVPRRGAELMPIPGGR